jgi:hypothetical protein
MNDTTIYAERRIRTLLARLDPGTYNLGDEIAYDKAFRSEEWPRNSYALSRPDMEAVLALLDHARSLRLASPYMAVDPAVHTPERVAAYLTARGWRQREAEPGFWDLGGLETVLVHRVATASDYAGRTGLLASDLASIYKTGELQILADIAEAGNG